MADIASFWLTAQPVTGCLPPLLRAQWEFVEFSAGFAPRRIMPLKDATNRSLCVGSRGHPAVAAGGRTCMLARWTVAPDVVRVVSRLRFLRRFRACRRANGRASGACSCCRISAARYSVNRAGRPFVRACGRTTACAGRTGRTRCGSWPHWRRPRRRSGVESGDAHLRPRHRRIVFWTAECTRAGSLKACAHRRGRSPRTRRRPRRFRSARWGWDWGSSG